MGKPVLNMNFQIIRKVDFRHLRILLPELSNFYDGHKNSKFFDQLVNKETRDANGYFTLKKEIWVAKDRNSNFCGFVCLNYKRGNTVKIGPIIVNPSCRGQGVGKFLINSSIEKVKKENIRKIYATTSSENVAATQLLKSSGFQLETELPDQYRQGKIELVWGHFIDSPKETFINKNTLLSYEEKDFVSITAFDSKKDTEYLENTINNIAEWHDDIDQSFCKQIIKATERGLDIESKGKLILVARSPIGIQTGIVVATPKRGGSVKIYPLYGNKHSIKLLIKALKQEFSRLGYRKLYTFSHTNDAEYQNVLLNNGFTLRGKLFSPYKTGYDLAVLDALI